MHKVQITHTGIDQRLEGRQPDTLENAGPQQTSIVMPTGATPRTGDDDHNRADDVRVPFPIHPRAGHEQEPRQPHAEEVVAGQQRHLGEGPLEVDNEGEGVGG